MTLQNEQFEEMLAKQLQADLEPQRGKALAAFRAQRAAEEAAPAPLPIERGGSSRRLWLWAGVPSLLAACIAVVVTLQVVSPKQDQNKVSPGTNAAGTGMGAGQIAAGNGGTESASPKPAGTLVFDTQADQFIVTHDAAGGVVMNNDTPLRVVRRQEIRQTRWVDPRDHATYTLTEPVERVGFVQVQPY